MRTAESFQNLPRFVWREDLGAIAIPYRLHLSIQPLKKPAINSNSDVILCHLGAVLRLAFSGGHGFSGRRAAPWALGREQVEGLLVVGIFHRVIFRDSDDKQLLSQSR